MDENKNTKTRYQQVIDGDVEPIGSEKGWLNLEKRIPINTRPIEEQLEIRRKGHQAMMQLHGEKKSARQSLEKILTIKVSDEILESADVPTEIIERIKRDNPNMTIYDLIQIVAIGKAIGGNMKAYELIRDTHGDKPIDKVEISDNVMTDADRELLKSISARLEDGDRIEIVKDIATENTEK
jgi:hypothetical protein